MNPSSVHPNSTLLPSQTIIKTSGPTLMVRVPVAPPGGPTVANSTVLPNVQSAAPSAPMDHSMVGHPGAPITNVAFPSPSAGLPPPMIPNGVGAPNSTAPSAGGSTSQSISTVANIKEKTPMCLINELARFNKAQHQYKLIDESGPPHKKTFTVVLKLDTEEYTASGPSIKKAQHAAASIALEQSMLKHPPPKSLRKTMGPITPTVELNALAMKRGEPAIYQLMEPQRPPQYIPNLNFRGMYHQRYHYPKNPIYGVSLKVGNRQFFGEGRTAQAARHAAAEQALTILRSLPFPDNVKKQQAEVPIPKTNGEVLEDEDDDDLKSPISLVHEIALKRGLCVNFEVTQETGPPHMRSFLTKCSVGDIVTEGEGNGKKVSKKRAAEQMLEELKKLPSLPLITQQKVKKKPVVKKKNRNLIKEQKSDPQYGQGINPISRLIQIQQAKKEREPLYTVIEERGEPRQREFLMQCALGDVTTTGSGPNKKTAKRNAAESMLQVMGYSRPIVTTGKPMKPPGIEAMYQTQQDPEKARKVTFTEHEVEKIDTEGKLGRQLAPGLLLMPDASGLNSDPNSLSGYGIGNTNLNRAPGGPIQNINKITMQTISIIAKELLETGSSPTADSLRNSGHKTVLHKALRPQQQLMHLADVLGLQVVFTDFPKGNKVDYISLVSLSTVPPLIKHGAGSTVEASHDQAAHIVLRALVELGIESVPDIIKKETTYNANLGSSSGLYLQEAAPKLANSSVTEFGNNPPKSSSSNLAVAAKDSH